MRDAGDAGIVEGLSVRRVVGADLVGRNHTNASDFSRPVRDWVGVPATHLHRMLAGNPRRFLGLP